MPAPARAGAAVAAVLLAALAAPSCTGAHDPHPWYAPDHAKLQLAGNVGFLSPGVGYGWGRRLEGDLFFGWVPEAVGGTDIFALTGKLTFAPWSIEAGRWSFRPATAGLQVTYTFGDPYFVVPRFAFTPTALRAGAAFGTDVRRRLGRRSLGVYAELVALDLGLAYWLGNRDALGPEDVFSLAVGARLSF